MGIPPVPKKIKNNGYEKKNGGGTKCFVSMWKVCIGSQTFSSLESKFSDLAIHNLFLFPFEAFSHLRDAAAFAIHLARCNYIIEGWIYDSSILDCQSRLGTHCQSTFERQCIENPGKPVPIHFIVTNLSVLPSTVGPLVTWFVCPLFRR